MLVDTIQFNDREMRPVLYTYIDTDFVDKS